MFSDQIIRERLLEKGLSKAQFEAMYRQYKYLKSIGKSTTLQDLVARSRMLSSADLESAFEDNTSASISAERLLPIPICYKYSVFPINSSGNTLVIKTTKFLTEIEKQKILDACSRPVNHLHILPCDMVEIKKLLRSGEEAENLQDLIEKMSEEDISPRVIQSVIKIILTDAITSRTSDIHMDRKPDPDSWISYRIDAEIKQVHLIPENIMGAIFTVIKSECGMDAANQRTAQDGRLSFKYRDRMVDFRVAAQPLVDGETLTLRILDGGNLPTLHDIFPKQKIILNRIDALCKISGKSGGIIMISGATGSGKSTTLYSLASRFDRDRVNIITVEDPVEYILPFSRQIQLQALLKQQARDVERSILRQDPDVLILGEIRDSDSARTALAFAESGHLVLCTIHANSVIQSIERFMSMIEENAKEDSLYVLAHHLKMAVHQKLAKRLCKCAEGFNSTDLESLSNRLKEISFGQLFAFGTPMKRVGCKQCDQIGLKGRVAVHETLIIEENEALRLDFTKWVIDEKFSSLEKLKKLTGTKYIERAETAKTLLNIGVIDAQTALNSIGILEPLEVKE